MGAPSVHQATAPHSPIAPLPATCDGVDEIAGGDQTEAPLGTAEGAQRAQRAPGGVQSVRGEHVTSPGDGMLLPLGAVEELR